MQPLGWEDPLKEGTATHSSILAWKIPMDKRACRTTVHAVAKRQTQLSARVLMRARAHTHTHTHARAHTYLAFRVAVRWFSKATAPFYIPAAMHKDPNFSVSSANLLLSFTIAILYVT